MTLDEALRVASDVYHETPTDAFLCTEALLVFHENADKFRRVEKVAALEDTESRCEMLLSQNDSLKSKNNKLSYENDALRDERNKLEAEMTEKNKVLADLMNELRELKSR